jgi:hypothetical protein
MNEGHSAFLGLERMRRLMQKHRLTFAAAREVASAGLVFTTHTPIAAGTITSRRSSSSATSRVAPRSSGCPRVISWRSAANTGTLQPSRSA